MASVSSGSNSGTGSGWRGNASFSNKTSQAKSQQCQKCLQIGHWTYQCKGERAYNRRPSRSAVVKNAQASVPNVQFYNTEKPPDPQRDLKEKVDALLKKKHKKKRKKSPSVSASSESESESSSENESSSSGSGSESSSSSGSESSSSSGSGSSSESSESDSDKNHKTKRRRVEGNGKSHKNEDNLHFESVNETHNDVLEEKHKENTEITDNSTNNEEYRNRKREREKDKDRNGRERFPHKQDRYKDGETDRHKDSSHGRVKDKL